MTAANENHPAQPAAARVGGPVDPHRIRHIDAFDAEAEDALERAAAEDDYLEWRAEEEARQIDDMANYS